MQRDTADQTAARRGLAARGTREARLASIYTTC